MGRTHPTPSMRTRRLLALLAGLLGAAALVDQLQRRPLCRGPVCWTASALDGLGGRLTLRPHSAADPDDGRPMRTAIKAVLHVAP